MRLAVIHTILGEMVRGRPGLLDLDCITVTGKTLGENIAEYDIRGESVTQEALELAAVGPGGKKTNQGGVVAKPAGSIRDLGDLGFDPNDCIRTCDRAYSNEGGLRILYGNLAQEGSVVKTAGVDEKMLVHKGPAVIFESQEDACSGILGKDPNLTFESATTVGWKLRLTNLDSV